MADEKELGLGLILKVELPVLADGGGFLRKGRVKADPRVLGPGATCWMRSH